MSDINRCFTKGKDLVTRCVAGETIIVPIKSTVGDLDCIYTLNEVSTTIWECIDGKTSISRIIEALCSTYDVLAEEAERDTLDFLKALEQAGLIDYCED
ncbi:MAG: PqqD family protein [Thermodesulfovibrionales bacterium]|jgi:hypothetical protein